MTLPRPVELAALAAPARPQNLPLHDLDVTERRSTNYIPLDARRLLQFGVIPRPKAWESQRRPASRLKGLEVRMGSQVRERSQFIAIDQASTSSSCVALGKSARLEMKSAMSAEQRASFRAGCQGGP